MATKRDAIAHFLTTGVGRYIVLAARVFLGAVFIYAAYSKVHYNGSWHFGDYQFFFAMGINSYDLYPLWFTQLAATIVPWIELALGLLMIVGVALRWVSSAMTLLLVVFMFMLTRAVVLRQDINCGCFGYKSVSPGTELLHDSAFFALVLIVTAAAFLANRAPGVSPDPSSKPSPSRSPSAVA